MASSQHTRFLQFCIQYTSIALIFYDYFLTWTREVKYVWMKKFTLSTVFYIGSRYSMVSNVLYLMAMARKLPEGLREVPVESALISHCSFSCTNAYRICCAFSVLGRAAVVCVLCARTYAIYNRNKYILAILGPIGATIIIMDSIHVRWVVCVGDPDPRNKIPEQFGFSLTFAVLLVVYEVLASMLTFYRSWQALRIRDDPKDVTNNLEYLVVKEGVLYFSFVSIFTLSTLVMLNVSPNGSFVHMLNSLTLPVSGLMTARFILHLREYEYKATCMTIDEPLEPLEFSPPPPENSDGGGDARGSQGSVVDEFGSCPISEARRHRKNTAYEDV